MVKKLKYLLFILPFFITLNVKAFTLGAPNSFAYFDDDTIIGPENATLAGFWGSNNYYRSPYQMGGVSSASYVKRIDFNWDNSNLCPNEDISISGYVAGLTSFFNEQSYTFLGWNGGEAMSCSTTIQENGSRLYYRCYGKGGGTLHIYLFQNSYSLVKQYTIGVSREVDLSCDVSNKAIVQQSITNSQNIINNQNSNTQDIINNQNQNNQNIINNQNSNTQDIINNQNSNTEKEIESQKVCNFINSSNISLSNSILTSSGGINSREDYGITDYIKLNKSSSLELLVNLPSGTPVSGYYCFYTSSKSIISCLPSRSVSTGIINIPTDSHYVRFTINSNNDRPSFKLCSDGNQALTDSITSEDSPNTSSELNDLDSSTASDTPISDLITLPITLINVFINGIDSSCSPVNLGNLYGTDLILPCIDIEQRLGSDLWSTIDILFSIFMCYNIGMLFVTAFSGITSLRDDFDSLYQPKHADTGYQPKHGG